MVENRVKHSTRKRCSAQSSSLSYAESFFACLAIYADPACSLLRSEALQGSIDAAQLIDEMVYEEGCSIRDVVWPASSVQCLGMRTICVMMAETPEVQ